MNVVGFINGVVYVSFKPLNLVDGFLVSGDRVLYAGSSSVVKQLTSLLGGSIVDLKGKTILPGFIDSHIHLDELGLSLRILDLRGVKSIRELKEKLRDYASKSRSQWIIGRGWDQELFEEKKWPTRWDLDEVVSDRPVLLVRVCGHAGVLNTHGLEITGLINSIDRNVLRNENGESTGIVVEDALSKARSMIREFLSVNDYVEFLKTAQEHLLSNGITTVGFVSCSLKSLRALMELWRRGELKIRVRLYLYPLEAIRELGVKAGFGDSYLKIMGVKLFADGSLGARTAWLSEPYSDDPSTSGYPVIKYEELLEVAKTIDENGLQLAVHAIGDKAIEMVLDVYRALENTKRLRHRIEHLSVLRDDELEEISKLGVVGVVQPHFIISDWWAKNRLGEKRVKWLYRFKSMIEKNVPIALSTDAPVEPVNPWETIYAAVTRGEYDNIPYYEDTREESLSVVEALHSYTAGSAYSLHGENELGTLKPGALADFIVVDRDPLMTPPRELGRIKVLETYVGGVRVWPS